MSQFIADDRLGRVKKHRWRTGTAECGGNFPANDARFPHSRGHHPTLAVGQQFHGTIEGFSKPRDQVRDGIRFNL